MSFSGPRLRGPDPAPTMSLQSKRILLVIGGGIAAYKSLDLIRRLRERGARVRVVMTRAAQEFITPLSVGAIAGERAFTDLFDQTSELDVGHIRLARETDLVVVAPATADRMAKMAHGIADDLAAAVLLATDKKILLGASDEPANVVASGDTAQSCPPHRRRPTVRRTQQGRDGRERRGRHRPHGRALGNRRRDRGHFLAGAGADRAQGPPDAGHLRPHAGADRSGALPLQPLLGPPGPRDRAALPRGPAPTCCWCPVPSKFPIPKA